MKFTTLRPGYLVSLKTSIRGNVSYKTRTIEEEQRLDDGATLAVWETERRVQDQAEQEEAIKVRSKARSLITSCCADSSFGLLCPDHKRPDLENAIDEARTLAEKFNQDATFTNISVYVIAGRVAADDVEAVRAINSEIRDLMTAMEIGINNLDVEAVRNAANKARQLGSMLSSDARERLKDAIDTARSCARKIVKAGESAAIEVDKATLRVLANARTAFLDVPDEDEGAPEMAEVATAARAIEMEPEQDPDDETDDKPARCRVPRRAPAPQIELE